MGKRIPKADMVNHPPHYETSLPGVESIDIVEDFTKNLSGFEGFCEGNVLKYLCRWKYKNGLEDLKKAQWYMDKLVSTVEKSDKKTRIERLESDEQYSCEDSGVRRQGR